MKISRKHQAAIILTVLLCKPFLVSASGIKVGNGNDGRDLEGLTLIDKGVFIDTQVQAVKRLKQLQVDSIANLEMLTPEVEKAELYLASSDVIQTESERESHQDIVGENSGKVFARTMPEAGAPTRFFPISMTLSQDQLVALHIHEALHRALPVSVRENESVVADINKAIMDPSAQHDTVKNATMKSLKQGQSEAQLASLEEHPLSSLSNRAMMPPLDSRPHISGSSLKIANQVFNSPANDLGAYQNMTVLSIQLGLNQLPQQILLAGLDLSYLKRKETTISGPIRLSAFTEFPTRSSFNLKLGAYVSANSAADEEFKSSIMGRDLTTAYGQISYKGSKNIYFDLDLALSGEARMDQKIGQIKYKHQYGALRTLGIRFGFAGKSFDAGFATDYTMLSNYKVDGGAFHLETGPLRVVKMGPELGYRWMNYEVNASYMPVLNASKDLTLEYMGDIFGTGAGQGGYKFSLSYLF